MYDHQIKAIARKYGITLVYLFGSEAERGRIYFEGGRPTPHPFSDLDVAVAFEKTLPEPKET
jgi:predicted nucleotidyltransferase